MRSYSIPTRSMDPRVRPIGMVVRWVLPQYTEQTFRLFNYAIDTFLVGHWLGWKTTTHTRYATRPDGTTLRLLICESSRKRKTSGPKTGLVWIHGGACSFGAPEQDFLFVSPLVRDGSCVAVMPAYTKSTAQPYPAAVDDCYLALQWTYAHAEELGIDRRQIFVGGDSAGGGLAAGVCIKARDLGEVPVAFHMPLYPMLDDRELTDSSRNNDAPVWNTASNRIGWEVYLRGWEGEVPSYAAPARETNLAGMPPACTFVGMLDPFHDETTDYVRRLREAGVPVAFREFPGCFHAFDIMAYPTAPARAARRFYVNTFREAQRTYFTAG